MVEDLGLRVWGGGQLVDALVSVCAKVVALRLRHGEKIIIKCLMIQSNYQRSNYSIMEWIINILIVKCS
jgi:hypothetical protein